MILSLYGRQRKYVLYQARALLQSITYVGKVYADSCDNSKVRKEMWLDDEPNSVSLVDGVQAKLYPNPNNGNFTLAYDLKKYNVAEVFIYDIGGRLIYQNKLSGQANNLDIQLNDVRNGIYFVKVLNGKEIISVHKVIINH